LEDNNISDLHTKVLIGDPFKKILDLGVNLEKKMMVLIKACTYFISLSSAWASDLCKPVTDRPSAAALPKEATEPESSPGDNFSRTGSSAYLGNVHRLDLAKLNNQPAGVEASPPLRSREGREGRNTQGENPQ
jgi:hypothetical protein